MMSALSFADIDNRQRKEIEPILCGISSARYLGLNLGNILKMPGYPHYQGMPFDSQDFHFMISWIGAGDYDENEVSTR